MGPERRRDLTAMVTQPLQQLCVMLAGEQMQSTMDTLLGGHGARNEPSEAQCLRTYSQHHLCKPHAPSLRPALPFSSPQETSLNLFQIKCLSGVCIHVCFCPCLNWDYLKRKVEITYIDETLVSVIVPTYAE